MKNTALLLMVLLCTLDSPDVFSQSIYIKHYSINEGLAGNHVYMCHQDAEGYLWIATTSGLSRFDGKKFKNYDYRNGLVDNEVLFVSHDANNNIWVNAFTSEPSLSVIKNNVVDHIAVPIGNNISEEYYSEWHKTIYMSGNHRLALIKPGSKPVTIITPLISGSRYFETEDHLILSGDGRNLYLIQDTNITFFQDLQLDTVYSRAYYYNRTLYLISGNSVYTYTYSEKKFHRASRMCYEKKPNLLFSNRYGLWVTFMNQKGAILYRDFKTSSKKEQVRIPGFVNYFCNDSEDGVWIATTDNGMFYIPNTNLVNYTPDDGIASSVVYAADKLSNDEFWLGYNTGKADRIKLMQGKISVLERANFYPFDYNNNPILDILHLHDEVYFLSRTGLFKKTQDRLYKIHIDNTQKSMYLLNDSTIAIGGWNYILYYNRSGKRIKYQLGRIYAHAVDTLDGLAWAGGIDGLFAIPIKNNGSPIHLQAFPQIKINALCYAAPYLLIGTQNNGLYIVHKDSTSQKTAYRKIFLPISNNVKAIIANNERVWVGTNKGLITGVVNDKFTGLENRLIIDDNDGLICSEINKITAIDSGVLVAGYGGISIAYPYHSFKHQYIISGVSMKEANTGIVNITDSIRTGYSTKGLEIGFEAVSLKYGSEMVYRYKLEPFDERWKITKNNTVQYTNIPPGDYHLRVYAYDNRGNTSPVKTLSIVILPLWWQTNWFKIGLLLMIAGICISGLRYYHSIMKKRTENKLRQDRLVAHAKLEALRGQLKPHFIFNSLNAIQDYIYNNKNDDAATLLQGFSGLIRNGLHLSDSDFTTIEKEVSFIKRYLELERMKCDNCFSYSIEVSKEIYNIVIPSLITQPFTENAVVHGVRSVQDIDAVIQISYSLSDGDLVCMISDNGIGIKKSMMQKKMHYSIGTHISQDRINYFNKGLGIDIVLHILDKSNLAIPDQGTLVTIIIKNIAQLQNHENNIPQPDSR